MSSIDTGAIISGSQGQRWKLKQLLGRGKCCDVFKAVLLDEDYEVAVKVYKKGLQYEGAQRRERLILQIVFKEQVHCLQLVQVTDSFQVGSHSILIEELLEFNLYQIALMTEGHGFSLCMIQMFTKDVLVALSAIHKSGFVHGDLKPCNLMWSAQKSCMKLIDFGLSFHVSDQDVGQIQTPSYRAPEAVWYNQGRNKVKLTPAVDLWSLGCLLIWMFTGRKIFQKEPSGPCKSCTLGGVESCEYGVLALQMIDDKISKEPMTLATEEMMPVCLSFKKLVSGVIQCKGCDRPTSQAAQHHPFFSYPLEPSFYDLLLIPTCVIRILNAIDEERPELLQVVKDELVSRCSKFGNIVQSVLPKQGPGKGIIFVKFEKAMEAISSFEKVNGKVLYNRTVITTYHSVRDFDVGKFY